MRCVTTRTGRQRMVMTAARWVWVSVLAASAALFPSLPQEGLDRMTSDALRARGDLDP